ncbi:hypothetical protein ACIRXL_08430 [Avibacterium paragallinarum]|uniref:hypothetical protein n=1 Tax=Avibacterium paragallinarum TaxID=728 RepID=UPI00397AB5E5
MPTVLFVEPVCCAFKPAVNAPTSELRAMTVWCSSALSWFGLSLPKSLVRAGAASSLAEADIAPAVILPLFAAASAAPNTAWAMVLVRRLTSPFSSVVKRLICWFRYGEARLVAICVPLCPASKPLAIVVAVSSVRL